MRSYVLGLLVLVGFCRAASGQPEAQAATQEFPYVIPVELGDTAFVPGDNISILEVRGTMPSIAVGGTYSVEGNYTLSSREAGTLALYSTSTKNTGPTPVNPAQRARIEKGAGTFRLIKTVTEDGYLHVSFYPVPSGGDFGGVYFGQGSGVLRQRGHRQLDADEMMKSSKPGDPAGANRALFDYLGEPVQTPADLDPKYSKEGLTAAVNAAAQQAGMTIEFEIEDSEFPYLIGVIGPDSSFTKLMERIKKMNGYADQGSVGGPMCHTMNIIPWPAFPSDSAQRIGRRLTVRQQMFFDRLILRRAR